MKKIDDMELLVKTLEFWTDFYFKDEKDCKNKAKEINELPLIHWELCNLHFIKERMAKMLNRNKKML